MLTPTPGSQGLENLDQDSLVKSAYNTPATSHDTRLAAIEARLDALEAPRETHIEELPRRSGYVETVRSGSHAKSAK